MSDIPEKINQLQEKLEILSKKQASFQNELEDLHHEIQLLKSQEEQPEKPASPDLPKIMPPQMPPQMPSKMPSKMPPGIEKFFGEKFIGENLINKIGIVITIIGVGIGAKYAIDHDLISPWTRIILGYLVGLGLLGFAIRLKRPYENFSAVLLSGSMAIIYFVTFAAYNFYGLIPLLLTFILMVLFTVFTVGAAIIYNKQVIAHIGLVGAYGVPFLLGNESGSLAFLFSYMAIVNAGILVISFRKYWKSIYYSSFILTWLIFLTWYIPKYETENHFGLSLTFISIFFSTFYLIFLAYKLIRKEKFEMEDILLLLANSTVFYGLGYAILRSDQTGEEFLGTFTLVNAVIHGIVAAGIYSRKLSDRNLLSFVVGLVLVFITIAIPVQLDGKWVTMLWAGEVAVLFWIGRTKNVKVYESLSYPLMFLVLCSLLHDWLTVYNVYDPEYPETRIIPLFNINFLTSVLFIASFTFMNILHNQKNYLSQWQHNKLLTRLMNFAMPAILLIAAYFTFVMEISTFWNQAYLDSLRTVDQDLTIPQHFWNEDILKYNTISIVNYSLLFLSLLSFVNILKIKNNQLGLINLGLNTIALGLFLTIGLFAIGDLRVSYISQSMSEFYYRGSFDIGIRYISFIFVGLMLFTVYSYIRRKFLSIDFKTEFDFLLHITLLTVVANELINWMDLFRSEQSYKLGLSILFGVYALFLIALGIWKKKKHLRIGAFVLFGATLVKLFFYDLTSLDTISKTIVFVSLGVLLLIISFLYNKYKRLIFERE